MAATIIIYAGAIVVTFLFVLMLAQQTGLDDADMRSREPLLASLTGFVLLGALLYVSSSPFRTGPATSIRSCVGFTLLLRTPRPHEEMDDVLTPRPDGTRPRLERLSQEDVTPA